MALGNVVMRALMQRPWRVEVYVKAKVRTMRSSTLGREIEVVEEIKSIDRVELKPNI